MQRVLVIGAGGSGKSTLARRIGAALGLPVIHLDAHYWRSGWTPTDPEVWAVRVNELARGETWVMDGNYGGTLDVRLAACDAVVFLDMPRLLCIWRVIRRRLAHRGRTRSDLAPGCREQLPWEFLSWIWNYPRRRRGGILRRLAELPPEKHSFVLRSPRAVDRFLADLASRSALGSGHLIRRADSTGGEHPVLIDSIRSLFAARSPRDSGPSSPARADEGGGPAPTADPVHLAACALLLDVAYADGEFSDAERAHLEEVLERHFDLPPQTGHQLIELADRERRGSIDHFQFTRVLKESYDVGQKMVLAEVMWGLVLADGSIAEHEHYLTRKIANLLDLEPGYLSAAKSRAAERS